MTIVSSTHTLDDHPQADGSIYVTEDHVDNTGKHIVVTYRAAPGTDYVAIRTQRAVLLGERQAHDEIMALLNSDADPGPLKYCTKAQIAVVLRELYRRSNKQETARLAAWVLNRLDAGFVTEAQVQAVFGLTAPQWTALKEKMFSLRAAYIAATTAAGE